MAIESERIIDNRAQARSQALELASWHGSIPCAWVGTPTDRA